MSAGGLQPEDDMTRIAREVRDEADRFWIRRMTERMVAELRAPGAKTYEQSFAAMNAARAREGRPPLEIP